MTVDTNDQAEATVRRFFSQAEPSFRALLVCGPSGSGKTTLVRRLAQQTRTELRHLCSRVLANDAAGQVETDLASAFHSSACVFIDNLDLWAPPQGPASSVVQARIVAALSDALATMPPRTSANRPAFVATALSPQSVHPSLVRPPVVSHVVTLGPLSYPHRLRWCTRALLAFYPASSQPVLERSVTTIATVTPGFLHADMVAFFSRIASCRASDPDAFPNSPERLVRSPLFVRTARAFVPALLAQMAPLLAPLPASSSGIALPVIGLEPQIAQLTQCINAVFAASIPNFSPADCPQSTLDALIKLRPPAGILIHGPSGCGKSTLVRQVANSLPLHAVNVMPVDSASIISAVIGRAERNLSTLFHTARSIAPTILIIDNIDVLAPPRHQLEQNCSPAVAETFSRLLSTLLVQIDGVRQSCAKQPPILVVATTRKLDLVDPALLRPGRFDIQISVDAPDPEARWDILQTFLRQLPSAIEDVDQIDESFFKKQSTCWTGADVVGYARQLVLRSVNLLPMRWGVFLLLFLMHISYLKMFTSTGWSTYPTWIAPERRTR